MADAPRGGHSAGYLGEPTGLYWERRDPPAAAGRPRRATAVMVHGGAHTGACWVVTPDGRPGWATAFLERGHPVVTPDWPGCGRSGHVPADRLTGELVCAALGALLDEVARQDGPVVLVTHSMSGPYGWRLMERHGERLRAVVAVAPGPPGNIQPEPPIVAESAEAIEVQTPTRRVRLALSEPAPPDDDFVRGKLIGASSRFPLRAVAAYGASLQPVPPRLSWERRNIRGSQLRVTRTEAFRGKPVLLVTGSHDTDHTREVDGAIVDWLRGLGARAEFCWLPDRGIVGNGHMLMSEGNSDEIAGLVLDWLQALG